MNYFKAFLFDTAFQMKKKKERDCKGMVSKEACLQKKKKGTLCCAGEACSFVAGELSLFDSSCVRGVFSNCMPFYEKRRRGIMHVRVAPCLSDSRGERAAERENWLWEGAC